MSTDALLDQNSVTEANFGAAREFARRCLYAIKELSLVCDDIPIVTSHTATSDSDSSDRALRKQKYSRLAHHIDFLYKVLEDNGVPINTDPLPQDHDDPHEYEVPEKLRKIEPWLILVSHGEPAHTKAFYLALKVWYAIENAKSPASCRDRGSYERNRRYSFEPELPETYVNDVRARTQIHLQLDFDTFVREVEKESTEALEAWRADGLEDGAVPTDSSQERTRNAPIALRFTDSTKTVSRGSQNVHLSPLQFALLRYVYEHGRAGYEELQDNVWEHPVKDCAIRTMISKLNTLVFSPCGCELSTRDSTVTLERVV